MINKNIIHVRAFLVFVFLVVLNTGTITAQISTPPPPPPESFGTTGNQGPMEGAPIGNGVWILLTFGLGYAFNRFLKKEPIDRVN